MRYNKYKGRKRTLTYKLISEMEIVPDMSLQVWGR